LHDRIIALDRNKKAFLQFSMEGEIICEFALSSLSRFEDSDGNSKLTELIDLIGIHNNKIWIHVRDRRLVSLDILNFSIKYEFDLCKELNVPLFLPIKGT